MGKGQIAKNVVISKIKEGLEKDFIGVKDNKAYVWSMEDGKRVQVCISFTCPKTPVEPTECDDFSPITEKGVEPAPWEKPPVKKEKKVTATTASKEEEENILNLCEKLGIDF